jgi:hypothetical protein
VPRLASIATPAGLARELRELRHRKVARSLTHVDLVRADETTPLNEKDLVDRDRGRLFLDYYGDAGIRTAFDRYGITAALARRGYVEVAIVTHAEGERHMLALNARPIDAADAVRIMEIVVRRDRMVPRVPGSERVLRPSYDVLTVDWLMLTSAHASFTVDRPRLPGQEHPGLGIGWRVLALLYRVVERLELDGLVTVAEYLHNAEVYARELPFLDPVFAGRLDALLDALRVKERLSLAQASWAVEWGLVRDREGAIVHWRGEAQATTREPTYAAWIESETYARHAREAAAAYAPRLDRAAFDARWAAERASLER